MTLANAFTKAWKDLKGGATKLEAFLAKNGTEIQSVVAQGSAVALAVGAPPAAVTAFDSLEEVIMGKLVAASQDAANTASLSTLIGDALPTVQALAATLKNHPTVASVTAALEPVAVISPVVPAKAA